jgi:protein-S-isoprenylcysteine O-methyltransferase Ste14
MSIFGAFLFAFLMIVRIAQMIGGGVDPLGILLAGQAGMAAFYMIFRQKASTEAWLPVQLLAWVSAILPLTMQTAKGVWGWLAAPGLCLTLWSMWSLGFSFSIAPAARKLVAQGPYRFIRHPMYAGEILSLSGAYAASAIPWNLYVLLVFIVSICVRIAAEEALFKDYSIYANSVKWRLVPGVW